MKRTALALCAVALLACEKKEAPPAAPEIKAAATEPKVSRADVNRIAAELALPIFWTEDKNANGTLDADELAVYWGLDPNAKLSDWVADGKLTDRAKQALARIAEEKKKEATSAAPTDPEGKRRAAVRKELAQGRVTLVATDLSKASDAEKKFVGHIVKAAELIEVLYAKQQGTTELASKVPADDPASKTLFWRGQGPKCEAPATQNDPNCSALPLDVTPKGKISGLYPPGLLDKAFCEPLAKKDKKLVDPFTVVTNTNTDLAEATKAAAAKTNEVTPAELAKLAAVPYSEAYKEDMSAIAKELLAASDALGETEPSLRAYLVAAAKAFGDNQWWPADEAWAKMDAKSSKFYLRIAPDEVYDEPCSTKALFHVSFGLINQGSLKWQAKLDPLKTEMENALAELAGPPYKARKVTFKLPDFVDIALNAGDSRKAFGATIGQSLPNFGPVANEGRGRTVAMTNFYTDPDSIAALKDQAESLFCEDTMSKYTTEQEPQLMSTVLHEAAHNLGPAHQYKVDGKIDREVFGGPLASTFEELKAQTAALYFTDWLVEKKEITREEADKAHVRDMIWAFGHISRGMWTEEKHPKNYSQLAAIQLGSFMKAGAVAWKAEETAANGKDKGCFSVALDKMPEAIKSLMTEVAKIKGKGDKAAAEALVKEHAGEPGEKKPLHQTITERVTRSPKASFVYSIRLD